MSSDALGFIVEGQPTTACRSYVDDVVRTGNVRQLGRGRYPFGQYSDDSQLARELVLSIVDRGKFDAVDYAGPIAALFRDAKFPGLTATPLATCTALPEFGGITEVLAGFSGGLGLLA